MLCMLRAVLCVQGVAMMLLILRTLRLGSMRVACVLLPLCFFYDVFWGERLSAAQHGTAG